MESDGIAASRRSIRKDKLRIEALVVPPLANNVYILYADGNEKSMVVDVAQGSASILKRLKELDLKLELIVNTHGHTDHTAEDELLRQSTQAKIAIHELDAYRLAFEDEASEQLHIQTKPIEPDIQLVNGSDFRVGPDVVFKVIHTPGHTEGSICLYSEKLGVLFSGDTLFAGGYGRLDGMGGDQVSMISSLKQLMALPDSTDVYPGHGSFTKIESESWINDEINKNRF